MRFVIFFERKGRIFIQKKRYLCKPKQTIMNRGKRTCEILKEVRRTVARENNIPLTEHECTFEGECRGTCPYCEAEVRHLEKELQRRISLGKAVTVAGIAVSSFMIGGCQSSTSSQTQGEMELPVQTIESQVQETSINSPENSSNDGEPVVYDVHPGELVVTDEFSDDESADWLEGELVDDDFNLPKRHVEVMPEFPGGLDSLYSFLQKELEYPKIAIDNGIQGTVLVEFVVEVDGHVSNAKTLISLSQECDKEAIRCVMSMPKWKPGYSNGKPERCYFNLPIRFTLSD